MTYRTLAAGELAQASTDAAHDGCPAPDATTVPTWLGACGLRHLDPTCPHVSPGAPSTPHPLEQLDDCGVGWHCPHCSALWRQHPTVAHLSGYRHLAQLDERWDPSEYDAIDLEVADGCELAAVAEADAHLARLEGALEHLPATLAEQAGPLLAARRDGHTEKARQTREAVDLTRLAGWLDMDRFADSPDAPWACENCDWCFANGPCSEALPWPPEELPYDEACGCELTRTDRAALWRATSALPTRVAHVVLVRHRELTLDGFYGNGAAAALTWFPHTLAPSGARVPHTAAFLMPAPLVRTITVRRHVVDAGPVPRGWARPYRDAVTDPAVAELVATTLRLWSDRTAGTRGGLANGKTALRTAAAILSAGH